MLTGFEFQKTYLMGSLPTMKNCQHMKNFTLLLILTMAPFWITAQKLEVEGKVKIAEMDRVTNATANVVRQADGTLAMRQYKVGDFAHGGIVYWVDETGEHGLVCDAADISTGINWSSNTTTTTGATGGSVSNGSEEGKGAGAMNTMLIVSENRVTGASAAKLCSDLVRGDYADWYLPSKGELNLMYNNKDAINTTALANGGSSFVSTNYWSSTESFSTQAWIQDFNTGGQGSIVKGPDASVRAIRAF